MRNSVYTLIIRLCSTPTGETMSESEDTAVESADESKFFTFDGPNPKLTYPLKIIYCDGKYVILYLVLSVGFHYQVSLTP